MNWEILFYLYLADTTILFVHEIDSAYWKEWELFLLPGKLTGFLIIHVPIIFFGLYGVVLLYEKEIEGLVISLIYGSGGFLGGIIHGYHLLKGDIRFRTPFSILIIVAMVVFSLLQVILAIILLL